MYAILLHEKMLRKNKKERYTVMFKISRTSRQISKRKSEKTKQKFLNPQAGETGQEQNQEDEESKTF